MKRILFVDDEPKILGGLRRMLRSLRNEWEMEFAHSGPEALDRLAASAFDVVVSDMRMPGMDGTQLLSEVRELHPDTVRIILSGQCIGPTHQFLTKPCDGQTLKSALHRACGLRDRLPDRGMKQAVSGVQSLPGQPAVHAELLAELASSTVSMPRVAGIIARDVAMSAKVLQLVSSSFFGTRQRVPDAAHAADLLGLDTMKGLVDSGVAFSPLDAEESRARVIEALNDHSLAVARAASQIAQTVTDDATLIGDARLAGLLHDVGALMSVGGLLQSPPERDCSETGPRESNYFQDRSIPN